MKKYNCSVIINDIEVCILSDSDHTNAFVVNGTIWNSFKNMSDFKDVLFDSFLLEGYDNTDELVDIFTPVIISKLERV